METFSIAQSGLWDGAPYTSADIKQQSLVFSVFFTTREMSTMSLVKTLAKGLKMAATLLEYPETRGIPIELIDTHTLRCGGANALALSGFSDTQIQKIGRWRGATFKEYIREQLACYSEGMTTKMKRNFKFVNVHGNTYHDVTSTYVLAEYACAA